MTVIRSKPYTFDENERDARFYAPRYADAHTVAMSVCGSTTVEYVADGCDSTLWLLAGELGSASALAFDPAPWVSITEARAAARIARKAGRFPRSAPLVGSGSLAEVAVGTPYPAPGSYAAPAPLYGPPLPYAHESRPTAPYAALVASAMNADRLGSLSALTLSEARYGDAYVRLHTPVVTPRTCPAPVPAHVPAPRPAAAPVEPFRPVVTLADYEAASTAATARRMANPRMASGTKVPHRPTALFLADHEVPTIASEWERSGWAQNAPGRRMGAHLAEKSARSSARISRELKKFFTVTIDGEKIRVSAEQRTNMRKAYRAARVSGETRESARAIALSVARGASYVPRAAADRVRMHRRARTIANMISAGASIGVVVPASTEPAEALAMLKASSRWESLPSKTRAGLSSAVARMRSAQSE